MEAYGMVPRQHESTMALLVCYRRARNDHSHRSVICSSKFLPLVFPFFNIKLRGVRRCWGFWLRRLLSFLSSTPLRCRGVLAEQKRTGSSERRSAGARRAQGRREGGQECESSRIYVGLLCRRPPAVCWCWLWWCCEEALALFSRCLFSFCCAPSAILFSPFLSVRSPAGTTGDKGFDAFEICEVWIRSEVLWVPAYTRQLYSLPVP